jgi:methionyl-tRNA formyltransferase
MSAIDWNRSPREIIKHICGLQPWPGATAELEGVNFKIIAAAYTDRRSKLSPGRLVSADPAAGIEIACRNGETVLITRLQAPGGKQMSAGDYLRGHPMKAGS